MMDSTADGSDEDFRAYARAAQVPGVVVLVQAGQAATGTIAITKASAEGVEIGRGSPHGVLGDDEQVSRGHVRVAVTASGFQVDDLGSRNGTFIDGVRLTGSREVAAPALLRLGRSLLWLVADIRPFTGQQKPAAVSGKDGPVVGGLSRRALGEIAIASKAGDTLLILGESGAGKELMARAFHEVHFGPGTKAPLVAVNCAAIPEGLAERLFFGAKRGAYSGATDADGYIVEAHGGTLFLDEVAELDLLVQAKLLRVFETREVMALGAATPRKVQIRICAATHKDLRNEVNEGRFRADLYYRIGRPEVKLPPLRERIDEIPWLWERVLHAIDPKLRAAVTTIEACAMRRWPGNVRELLQEARRAAHAALQEGADVVRPEHMTAEAGLELSRSSQPAAARTTGALDDAAIEAALREHGGNVSRTAKALGLHRNQLRRWVAKHPTDPTHPTHPTTDAQPDDDE